MCACRSCDGEGRKDKGGGGKVREVKTVVWIKLSIHMYQQHAASATQSDDPCHQVPRLPRKVKVHVTKCHACHAKSRGIHGVN